LSEELQAERARRAAAEAEVGELRAALDQARREQAEAADRAFDALIEAQRARSDLVKTQCNAVLSSPLLGHVAKQDQELEGMGREKDALQEHVRELEAEVQRLGDALDRGEETARRMTHDLHEALAAKRVAEGLVQKNRQALDHEKKVRESSALLHELCERVGRGPTVKFSDQMKWFFLAIKDVGEHYLEIMSDRLGMHTDVCSTATRSAPGGRVIDRAEEARCMDSWWRAHRGGAR
jgi:hypothetical protein